MQNPYGPVAERNAVFRARFHAFGGDDPNLVLEVELVPKRANHLASARL